MRTVILTSMLALSSATFAAPAVTVTAVSQNAEDHLVTVAYTLSEPAIVTFDVRTNGVSIGADKVCHLSGDVNRRLAAGEHVLSWQPREDWPADLAAAGAQPVVLAWALDAPPDYMVVDCEMPSNVWFYASAEAVPGGVVSDLSRTARMVFRKIPAAGIRWRMGTPSPLAVGYVELQRPHYVTLTNDYYMAVFETTVAQRSRALRTSLSTVMRPDDSLSYEQLRGVTADYDWPDDGHAVAPDSIIGKFRALTGLKGLDLPTDAEWEYACRAGDPSHWYNGKTTMATLSDIAWFNGSDFTLHGGSGKSVSQVVGLLEPNAWGIYDMLGNLFEYCLDWNSSGDNFCQEGEEVTAPTGPRTGSGKVLRGGAYTHGYACASMAYRYEGIQAPADGYYTIGYRLACPADFR